MNERLPCLTQEEAIFPVHVVGMELYFNGFHDDKIHAPSFLPGYWCHISECDDPGLCCVLPQSISMVDTEECADDVL